MDGEPELARIIIASLTRQLHTTLERLDDLLRYPLKYRLGKSLLQLALAEGNDLLQVRQSELADIMGVSRVTVGKALSLFQKAGFIVLKYGSIKVVDRAEFHKWLKAFDQIEPLT